MNTATMPARQRGPITEPGWTIEVHRDADALTALRVEWDGLYERCRSATPFQTHAWLDAWWRCYGVPGQLRLVLVRRDGRLLAGAALHRRRRGGCAVLAPIGGALSDYTDVLVADGAPEAASQLARALCALGGWQALDFPEVAGRTALYDAWPGARRTTAASLCLALPAGELEPLVRELPSHPRKTVRRRLNQLGRLPLTETRVPAGEADRAIADLLALHQRQWRGRHLNPEHARERFARHLRTAVGRMLHNGQAELVEYRLDGRLVASSLLLVGRHSVGGYLYGAEPELRERLDVTTLLLRTALPLAHRLGRDTMDMLRGAEPHKLAWRPRAVANQRVLLARPGSVRGVLYLRGVGASRACVEAAKRHAPWLRAVRDRVRRALSTVVIWRRP